MRRGEVWWANLPHPWGRRPVVLLARDEGYAVLTWIVAAPLTTTIRRIPSAVLLDPAIDHVARTCAVTLDNMMAPHIGWIDDFITHLRPVKMAEIDAAIHFTLALRD